MFIIYLVSQATNSWDDLDPWLPKHAFSVLDAAKSWAETECQRKWGATRDFGMTWEPDDEGCLVLWRTETERNPYTIDDQKSETATFRVVELEMD